MFIHEVPFKLNNNFFTGLPMKDVNQDKESTSGLYPRIPSMETSRSTVKQRQRYFCNRKAS